MRAPAVSFARKLMLAAVMGLLACSLVPLGSAFAEGEGAAADALAEELQEVSAVQPEGGSGVAPMLASGLVGVPSSVVSADVALDGEPVIGSFTVDGLTFAVTEGSDVELVGVSSDWQQVPGSQEGDGSPVAPMLAAGPDRLAGDGSTLVLPESIAYEGVDYAVTSIGAYALYLSGITAVELPASVAQVDDRAFRSSDVASVTVADGNPSYSSFDGALYDAAQLSLLLIPEGKQGTVLLPKTAEMASPSVFSHCSLVQAIAVEEGSAAFASENGLLYDASLTTLLRVPAGATDIVIHDGCTTIAAGAMEVCASLAAITAPASVTSISPYLFEQEPETVMAPVAVAAVEDEAEGGSAEEGKTSDATSQLTAMVALSATDDDLPAVDPAAIAVSLPAGADLAPWRTAGLEATSAQGEPAAIEEGEGDGPEGEESDLPVASLGSASTYAGAYDFTIVNAEGSTLYQTNSSGSTNTQIESRVIGCGESSHQVHVRFLDKGGSLIVQLWHSATSDNSYYRWVKPGYVLVGVKVTNGAGTITDEIRATAVNTSYAGASKITGAGRTISPIFEKVTYTVKLNGNGATTMGTESVQVEYGQAMPAITTPTRPEYKFKGFFSGTSSTATQYYDISGKPLGTWDRYEQYPTSLSTSLTYTLYAQWESVGTVSLTWDTGNGIIDGNHGPFSRTLTYVDGKTLSDAWEFWSEGRMRYYGYTFQGWYTAASGGTRVYESTPLPSANTTYYAHWTANTIRTTWNCNGGNIDGGSEHIRDTVYSESKTLGDAWGFWSEGRLRRAGYSFAGWFTAASGGTQVAATTALPTASATYYAHWTANTIRTTWNCNGGNIDGGSEHVRNTTYSEDKTLGDAWEFWSEGRLRRAGYSFAGWWTAASGGTQVTAATALPTTSTTYYAHWAANTIKTTWNYNGGSIDGGTGYTTRNTVYASNKTLGDALESEFWAEGRLRRTGYSFVGWFTAASGGTQVTAATALPTTSTTYYAHWTAKTYDVTFDAAGGTIVGGTTWIPHDPKITFDTGSWSSVPAPIRAGYVFTGWYDAVEEGTQVYSPNANGSASCVNEGKYWKGDLWGYAGNATFYAQWTPAISADVPIEVTASVDLLGIEDQAPASGYIESRCGAPLAVEQVSFTALAGAAELFGEANTASVSLQALALEGDASWEASAPTFSFPLSANATESDATKLAAFRMGAYEERIPISYRFAIPEDVLAAIDQARFEGATTPVCSVVYKVALAQSAS